jgi:hypothetical protein
METEVAFSGFDDATNILDDACGATIELLYTSIMRVALMSTSTVRRILLVRFVDRLRRLDFGHPDMDSVTGETKYLPSSSRRRRLTFGVAVALGTP